jgi:hypothetical protein
MVHLCANGRRTWVKIEGLSKEVSDMLYENEITGRELLALIRDYLKMMGVKRDGTEARCC